MGSLHPEGVAYRTIFNIPTSLVGDGSPVPWPLCGLSFNLRDGETSLSKACRIPYKPVRFPRAAGALQSRFSVYINPTIGRISCEHSEHITHRRWISPERSEDIIKKGPRRSHHAANRNPFFDVIILPHPTPNYLSTFYHPQSRRGGHRPSENPSQHVAHSFPSIPT